MKRTHSFVPFGLKVDEVAQHGLPGISASHVTPGTNATWHDLASWFAPWAKFIERGSKNTEFEKAWAHLLALVPHARDYINECEDDTLLRAILDRLHKSHFIPPRGYRENHPTTALVVDIKNRLRILDRARDHASLGMGHNSTAMREGG